ncbi:MAG: TetR/AcrR family transcriptional regulator [Myxococcota bacterium]
MTRHLPEQTRREQILAAARKCFIERGYHPTRMEDIAAAAGLSKGGVYFHFDSKKEVFDALVEDEFEDSMRAIQAIAAAEGPIVEKMTNMAGHFVTAFAAAPEGPRFFIVMGEMALRDPDLAAKLRERQGTFIGEITKLVEQGIREGFLRDTDARTAATLLKALVDGVEALAALSYPVDMGQLLAQGLQMIMGGLAKA